MVHRFLEGAVKTYLGIILTLITIAITVFQTYQSQIIHQKEETRLRKLEADEADRERQILNKEIILLKQDSKHQKGLMEYLLTWVSQFSFNNYND